MTYKLISLILDSVSTSGYEAGVLWRWKSNPVCYKGLSITSEDICEWDLKQA
jgi:hypothetical protein